MAMTECGARAALVVGVVVSLLATRTVPALGQEAPGATLEASKTAIDFGEKVSLTGRISPPQADQTVHIIDQEGRERAVVTTDDRGHFKLRLRPRYSTQLAARWVALISAPVDITVRPDVSVRLGNVRLFGAARIIGTVRPTQESGEIVVRLFRSGRRIDSRRLPLREGRWFSSSFRVTKAAKYRSRASFTDADGARGADASARVAPPLPSLAPGSQGAAVRLLETRLRALAYHLGGVDRRYDERTADAMRAFNKIEGRRRIGTVDAATWRALANANRARPRYRTDGFHIEVDQTRQVLMMVKNSRVTGILHVSTGAGAATRDGDYRVYRKLAGYSGGRLYYPSYFDGLRALHGWPEVPTYNASHGCVRLPMWSAQWVHAKADKGTAIRIYH